MAEGRRLIYPPVILFMCLLFQLGLHFGFPMQQLLTGGWRWLALLPLGLGLLLIVWVDRLFRRAETTILPFKASTALVTHGPFRFSRNPIYLAMALILAAVAWWLGSATPWLVVPLFVFLIRDLFIRPEEDILAETFGEPYRIYRQQVRRWL